MNSMFLQAGEGADYGTLIMMGVIIVIMYLFFLRPQAKRQREETKFRNEIVKGAKVVTTSGIHGKISEVGDTYVILELDGGRIKLEKSAISKELSAQYNPDAKKKK